MTVEKKRCPGCGTLLKPVDGPTHSYMISSPACFEIFTRILASEYSNAELLATHRLTVDTYAVQHPGSDKTRQQIQSVGLHLARLSLQLQKLMPSREANDIMVRLGKHKSTLVYLEPPQSFSITVSDIEPYIGGKKHISMIKEWAAETWMDWSEHHNYINSWTSQYMVT
jgi:hypothetical protein